MSELLTLPELRRRLELAGKSISQTALRNHCRKPQGLLYGRATLVGRQWLVPAKAANEFVRSWERYGALKK